MSNFRRRLLMALGPSVKPTTLRGRGRVHWNGRFNAYLPKVKVYGEGKQDTLSGKNLADPLVWTINTPEYGDVIHSYVQMIPDDKTRPLSISCDFKVISQDGNFRFEIHYSDGTKNSSNLASDPSKWTHVSVSSKPGKEIAYYICNYGRGFAYYKNLQIEYSPVVTPYEPYCGGIPAPNPQYPIEPEFLEGASVVGRGKNLIDYKKAVYPYGGNRKPEFTDNGFIFEKFSNGNRQLSFPFTISPEDTLIFSWNEKILIGSTPLSFFAPSMIGDWHEDEYGITNGQSKTFKYSHDHVIMYLDEGRPDGSKIEVTFFQAETGSTPTPYEPFYDGGTAPLPILRALPDGSVRDEMDVVSGTVVRRIGVKEFDGSSDEDWSREEDYNRYNLWLQDLSDSTERNFAMSNRFYFTGGNNVGSIFTSYHKVFFYMDKSISTVELFKTWLTEHSTVCWYALKDPIIEHYDPAILRQHPGYTQLIQQGGFRGAEIEADVFPVEEV